jgi:glycosyltransferase involved in cell wall biosynthesis
MQKRKLRVLVIADACSPACPSVPLEGYSLACSLARNPDLHITLVTQIRNRAVLKDSDLNGLAEIDYIDTEWVAAPLKRFGDRLRAGGLSWTIDAAFHYPGYVILEYALYKAYRERLRNREFDIIHRITPISPTSASPLAYKTDTPMIIGPLNGGLPWPRQFPGLAKREKEYIRRLRFMYKFIPFNYAMYRNLKGIIVGSHYTGQDLPRYFRGRRYYVPENGVDPVRFPLAGSWPEPAGEFRFITVGRIVPYKGMDLILEAMNGSSILRSCRLTVAGDGPFRAHLEELAAQLGLEDRVVFTGHINHEQLSAELRSSQAFVFPSLREFGGAVVLEAMSCGLPPIVVDYGGPGEHVTPECGIGLPLTGREELIANLRAAMESLATDHDRCRRLGAAAIERVRADYTWDVKAAKIAEIYADLLNQGPRPS